MTDADRDQIDAVMDEFDFHGVHRYMVQTGWEWADDGGVPPVSALRRCARRLLANVMQEGGLASTGGFTAVKVGWTLYLFFAPWDGDAEQIPEGEGRPGRGGAGGVGPAAGLVRGAVRPGH